MNKRIEELEKQVIEENLAKWDWDMTKLNLFHKQCVNCDEIENTRDKEYICKKCNSEQVLRTVSYYIDQVVYHIVKQGFAEDVVSGIERFGKEDVEND